MPEPDPIAILTLGKVKKSEKNIVMIAKHDPSLGYHTASINKIMILSAMERGKMDVSREITVSTIVSHC